MLSVKKLELSKLEECGLTPEQVQKVFDLLGRGMSVSRIADEVGATVPCVKSVLDGTAFRRTKGF